MTSIRIDKLTITYGDTTVISDLDLSIENGEFFTLLGPSGCGKTTLLRSIAGFITPASGHIAFGDQDVTRIPTYRRNIGMMFQDYALFPDKTVATNVAYGLKARKTPRGEIPGRVTEALERVGMAGFADRLPGALSGGQRQRVALARALVIRPSVLLMDEPLSALDTKLRLQIREAISDLQREVGITTVFVTHDQEEALSMSDRIALFRTGTIEQLGTPTEIYRSPVSSYAADFIGAANVLSVSVRPMRYAPRASPSQSHWAKCRCAACGGPSSAPETRTRSPARSICGWSPRAPRPIRRSPRWPARWSVSSISATGSSMGSAVDGHGDRDVRAGQRQGLRGRRPGLGAVPGARDSGDGVMSVQTEPDTQAPTPTSAPRKERLEISPWLVLTLLAVVLSLIFVVWPILSVLLGSVSGGGLGGWVEFFTGEQYLQAVGNTLLLAAIVTVLATAIGVFLAYFTSRFRFWLKAVVAVLPITALLVPEVIVTQAWLMFLGNNGFLTRFMRDQFDIAMPTLYGWRGLILILPLLYYTYVYLGTLAALKSFDSQLEEAAMSLGSSPIAARMKVMIPTILPAVGATSILVFTLTIGNFATSAIIGGKVPLLAPLTYKVFLAETGGNPMMQSTLATVSIAIVALILFVQRRTVGRRSYEMVQGRSWVPIKLRGVQGVVLSLIAAVLLIASTLPMVMVTVMAFTVSRGPVLRWGEFSLDNIRRVLTREPQPIINTITFGAVACAVGIIISIVVSVVIVKKKNALTPALDYIIMLPMALSGTVLGIGMMTAFGSGPITLSGTTAIIVLVLVVRRLPHGIRNASATLHSIPNSLEDASVSLGVPPFRSFLKVVLPLMVPGIAAATVLTWTTMIAELSASLVVYSAGKETITIKVFQLMNTGLNGQAAAYGLILTLLAIVPIVIATKVFKIRLFN